MVFVIVFSDVRNQASNYKAQRYKKTCTCANKNNKTKDFCIFSLIYLVNSKKSSNFACFFALKKKNQMNWFD